MTRTEVEYVHILLHADDVGNTFEVVAVYEDWMDAENAKVNFRREHEACAVWVEEHGLAPASGPAPPIVPAERPMPAF